MDVLNHIRKPERRTLTAKAMFHTAVILSLGMSSGVIIKLFDIYTANLGNVFRKYPFGFSSVQYLQFIAVQPKEQLLMFSVSVLGCCSLIT